MADPEVFTLAANLQRSPGVPWLWNHSGSSTSFLNGQNSRVWFWFSSFGQSGRL